MSDSYPYSWERTQVQKVITKSFCGHSPTCEERTIANEKEWGILKTTAITWDGWNENAHKVPPPKYWCKESIEVKKGDVLVTKAGPRHRVGVVVHVQSTKPHLMVSGKMIGLRPQQEKVLPRILAAALSMREPQIFLDHRSTGMAESQVNFNNDVLLTTSILLPPIPEQRAIAAVLDTVDETIRRTETLIAKLRQERAGMLHDLLTRGLDENGELRDPIRHPEQFKDSLQGRIPLSWNISLLIAFATLQRGFDITVADQIPGNIPVVSSSGITSYHNKAIVNGPGVVIGRKGKLGGAYFIEGPFWPHDTSLWVKDFHGNDEKFTALYLKFLRLERFDAATSVPTLNRNIIHPMLISTPKKSEQINIVKRIEKHETAIQVETSFFRKLAQIKQGLMYDLLTGNIRVPESMIQKYQTGAEVL